MLYIPSPRGTQKGQGVSICMVKSSGLEWSNSVKYHFKSELCGLTLTRKPCYTSNVIILCC